MAKYFFCSSHCWNNRKISLGLSGLKDTSPPERLGVVCSLWRSNTEMIYIDDWIIFWRCWYCMKLDSDMQKWMCKLKNGHQIHYFCPFFHSSQSGALSHYFFYISYPPYCCSLFLFDSLCFLLFGVCSKWFFCLWTPMHVEWIFFFAIFNVTVTCSNSLTWFCLEWVLWLDFVLFDSVIY